MRVISTDKCKILKMCGIKVNKIDETEKIEDNNTSVKKMSIMNYNY